MLPQRIPIYDPDKVPQVPNLNAITTIMYEKGTAGSQDDTVEMKEESALVEEAIKKGIDKASDTSVQSQEETVSLIAPTNRGQVQTSDYRK